jgi:hypothetical protein
MNLATQRTSSDDLAVDATLRTGQSATLAAAALVALAAIVIRAVSPEGADVSWLLTVGERMLDGQRLYVDIWETNPPLSPLIYLPGVAAARALGVSPELMTGIFAGLAVTISGLLTLAILRAGNLLQAGSTFILAFVFALAFLPLDAFGQREHVAILAVLPIVAVSAVRAEARPLALVLALAAGFGGGFAMGIKPYFALAILFPYAFAALRRRSLRPIFGPETFLAGALVLAYGAAVAVWYPEFYETMLPVLADTYRHGRQPLLFLLSLPQFTCYLLLAATAVMTLRPRRWPSLPTALLLASTAFPLAYLDQGQGWAYHLLPGFALALLAAWTALEIPFGEKREQSVLVPAFALVGAILAAVTLAPRPAETRALVAEIAAMGIPAPTVLGIGPDIAVGHPLSRMLGGRWAGTAPSQWMSKSALQRASTDPENEALAKRLQKYLDHDRALLVGDIARHQPDILIFDRRAMDWLAWARRDAALAEAIRSYEPVATVAGLEVWRRS